MKNKFFFPLLHIAFPIFLSSAIYFFFRFNHRGTEVPNWIKYNLPDGLWFYSLVSFLFTVWEYQIAKPFLFWLFSVSILVFASEFLQQEKIIFGTYDIKDFLAYLMAFFSAILLNILHINFTIRNAINFSKTF